GSCASCAGWPPVVTIVSPRRMMWWALPLDGSVQVISALPPDTRTLTSVGAPGAVGVATAAVVTHCTLVGAEVALPRWATSSKQFWLWAASLVTSNWVWAPGMGGETLITLGWPLWAVAGSRVRTREVSMRSPGLHVSRAVSWLTAWAEKPAGAGGATVSSAGFLSGRDVR